MKSFVLSPAVRRRVGVLGAGAALLMLAGCSDNPSSRLIDISFRPKAPPQGVTIPETQPDGYPNLSYKPVPTPPQKMNSGEQQVFRSGLEKNAERGKAIATSAPGKVGSPEELQQIGATHVDETRAAITGDGNGAQPAAGDGSTQETAPVYDPDADAGATN